MSFALYGDLLIHCLIADPMQLIPSLVKPKPDLNIALHDNTQGFWLFVAKHICFVMIDINMLNYNNHE